MVAAAGAGPPVQSAGAGLIDQTLPRCSNSIPTSQSLPSATQLVTRARTLSPPGKSSIETFNPTSTARGRRTPQPSQFTTTVWQCSLRLTPASGSRCGEESVRAAACSVSLLRRWLDLIPCFPLKFYGLGGFSQPPRGVRRMTEVTARLGGSQADCPVRLAWRSCGPASFPRPALPPPRAGSQCGPPLSASPPRSLPVWLPRRAKLPG